ncbi:MAG: hypothetical protein PHZ00_04090 [Candidatus Peribacteraceae bacterium]|nr:hypothetical protein [Candidatus Peribacteraceae bacterium]
MKFILSGVAATELQKRFVLAPAAPYTYNYPDTGCHLEYFFELDGIRLGLVGLFNDVHSRHISWSQFYPLCLHLTPEEVVALGYADTSTDNKIMDYRRRSCCDWHTVPEGLEKKWLGTLAHTLVARHLYESILNSDRYTTAYASAISVDPRLNRRLQRAQVQEMVTKRMSLEDVQSRLTDYARRECGFTFENK